MAKQGGHEIKRVAKGSISDELGIEPGDRLLAVNNEQIEDVFDYRYLLNDEYIEVLIQKPDGEEWLLEIEKEYEEDLGIEFDSSLMSKYRSCSNQCIFCFIDQMPPGMRETLYFKDDDARLSFLQGNYITMTNMQQKDIDRIIRLHLAPVNISVQTTNPELRCKMLNNRFAGEKLKFLKDFYDGKMEMNGQIVLCKNVNDGKELARTIRQLSGYLPYMKSVSVVPVGISKYREGLYPLEAFTKQDARTVLAMIESRQQEFYSRYGRHFIHASDEWYLLAEKAFPDRERYDGYLQLENGVGMMRMFMDEFYEALASVKEDIKAKKIKSGLKKTLTIATAKLSYPTIKEFAAQITKIFTAVTIHVCEIENDFFGAGITVSGLLTGQDLIRQLGQKKAAGVLPGGILLIASNMLRAQEQIFLDDVTVSEVEAALQMKVIPVEADGRKFVEAVLSESPA